MQVVEKTVEISQLQAVEKIVETRETQMIQSIQTSESLNNDPDAKIKLIAEEELHGVGGFVSGAHGNRVANELGGRNCVTGEMWKNEPPFSLTLNKATSHDIAWQCKHYTQTWSQEAPRVWYSTCRRCGSASVEDAGFDRSP